MAGPAHTIQELDRKGLREFGLVFGGMIAAVFGLLLPWLFDHAWPRWPWIALAVFAAWSLAAPQTLRPVYRAWMTFALLMSRITTPLIMGLVYYVVISPVGLFRRVVAPDPMKRGFDRDATSYRSESEKLPPERLKKPF